MRTEAEIVDVLNLAADAEYESDLCPGSTYQKTVLHTLQWVMGDIVDPPLVREEGNDD